MQDSSKEIFRNVNTEVINMGISLWIYSLMICFNIIFPSTLCLPSKCEQEYGNYNVYHIQEKHDMRPRMSSW
jgi:hypothetical protein